MKRGRKNLFKNAKKISKTMFLCCMDDTRNNIVDRLRQEVLSMQGQPPVKEHHLFANAPQAIMEAFPNKTFPVGAVHEFVTENMEEVSATAGFISGLLQPIVQSGRAMAWISMEPFIFPLALKQFGLEPDKILFIRPAFKKDLRWVTEEVLRCEALSAVVAEWNEMNFTESRRLQLAVESSKGTACVICRNPGKLQTTASFSRWQIRPIPSEPADGLPGVGFARWQVALHKVRNGRPGTWIVEWGGDHMSIPVSREVKILERIQKTG